jgi:hypothetical protein
MKRFLLSVVFIVAASAVCSAQTFYFPHVAVGTFNGGAWKTTIFLSNAKADTASGVVTLTKSDASAFVSTWVDEMGNVVSNGNTIPFQLGPSQSRRFSSVANIPLTSGFATVTSNSLGVLGNAMFTQLNSSGAMVAEAGVPMGVPLGKQAVFVDTTNGFNTGVAIANPNTAASLHIHFELVDDTGAIIMTQVRDLPPSQHFAFFVGELFPGAPPMVGRLQFYCVNPIVSVALRFEPAFTLFTTMPPIAIAP